jgi:hypothetical protein
MALIPIVEIESSHTKKIEYNRDILHKPSSAKQIPISFIP